MYEVRPVRDLEWDLDELNRKMCKTNAFSGILAVHHIVFKKENGIRVFFADETGGALVERHYLQRGKMFVQAEVSLVKSANR